MNKSTYKALYSEYRYNMTLPMCETGISEIYMNEFLAANPVIAKVIEMKSDYTEHVEFYWAISDKFKAIQYKMQPWMRMYQ